MATAEKRALAPMPEKEYRTLSTVEVEWNAAKICGPRGWHGPFANEAHYDAFGGVWEGSGECRLCWNTCNVALERERERDAKRKAAEIEAAYREDAETRGAA